MIRFLDISSFLMTVGYGVLLHEMIKVFLPLRRWIVFKVLALLLCTMISDVVVYANDFVGIFWWMAAFFLYVLLFFQGGMREKMSVVLLLFPIMVAVNYLMLDIFSDIYFRVTQVNETPAGSPWMLFSTGLHTFSVLLRLIFWILVWLLLHKRLKRVVSQMTVRMWMIVDALMLSSFVAICTIIYALPENALIDYPICLTSMISSVGCMYLASYICESVQAKYRAQQMEMQSNYYKQKIQSEERVRRIYHDMKNHLLILEQASGSSGMTQRAIRELQTQIQDYENYIHTGNEFLDIIIQDKSKTAREKNIDFSVQAHMEDAVFLEPLDVSTLFGNALDNAIEASEKLPENKRFITVKAGRIRGMMVISISNNTPAALPTRDKTDKEDKFLHGFGLENIRTVVQKYDGQYSTKIENDVFTLKIIFPVL